MTYGKAGQVSSMLCVCHSPHDDLCFAGADNGEIYVWQGTTLRRTIKGHKGAVYAMYALRNTAKEVRCCMFPLRSAATQASNMWKEHFHFDSTKRWYSGFLLKYHWSANGLN